MPVPDLDATVRGLYRAATGDASWDQTLAGLRDALGAADVQLLHAAPGAHQLPVSAADARRSVCRWPTAGGHTLTRHLDTHAGSALSLQITWQAGQPPAAAVQAWLDRLAPHLQDALRTAERLRQWPARSQLGALLLDALAHPAWLLQADGGIVRANAAARQAAAAGGWLRAGSPALALQDAADQQALDLARAQALAAPQARPVLVPPPVSTAGGNGAAAARPSPPRRRWLLRRLETPGADPMLLVILFDPQATEASPSALSAPLLAGAFGFTPAESRVAVFLAQGRTVREIAGQLNVAPSTVRSHLDAVMAKLGVTRKLDAVRLLVQGGWMWRDWPDGGRQDA